MNIRVCIVAAVAIASAMHVGCYDFSPIIVPTPDAATASASSTTDGGADDASAEDGGVSPDGNGGTACQVCVAQTCANAYDGCTGTAKCLELFACGDETGCFEKGANITECLTPCGVKAGLSSASDPAVTAFFALYMCATSKCGAECS